MKKRALLVPLEWTGIALALLVMSVLPRPALLALCDLASAVLYRFDKRGRALALANLRLIDGRLSASAEERIIRRSYRNMSRTIGHLFWTSFRARTRVAKAGEMSAEGKAFLAANRQAVTVSGHIGCWESLSQLAYLEGHSMMSVAKDIGTPAMTRLLMWSRRSIGQKIVPVEGAFKELMKGVREGCSLGLLVDQHVDPKDGGIWVRFLGQPIPVSAAPAFFSAKAKAPIVTAWSRPLKDGRYRCEVIGTYTPEDARDVWAMTQRCASDLERVIRRHPSCWVLNYNFFSNRPTEKDLAQLAKRESAPFALRPPREVVYHVRPGEGPGIHFRIMRDLRARSDGNPLRLTVVLPDESLRQGVESRCAFVCERFADVSFEITVEESVCASRLAVVIPAYNVEKFLPQCLDSLLAQTMPVDVFCCDDGSTDATGKILDDYAARHPRIHALHHPNRGMSATYNRLLDELPPEYEFVGIVDSDDYVHPEMYDALLSAMAATGADVAECGVAAVSDQDVQPAGTSVALPTDGHRTVDDMSVYWVRRTAPSGWISKWNKLYRRSAIGDVRFRIGLDYEDDFFFATEVNARIRRKVILSDRFYAYRRNPNSMNGRINFRKYLSSAALRLRLSCETFLVTGRVPKNLEAEWRCDFAKDAYRMLVRKNLKKNPDATLRREIFREAGEALVALARDFGVGPDGLNPVQRLICKCCIADRYALARLLVALT